jgi:hypothetical protein
MAVTTIEAVRVFGGDGTGTVYPWDPSTRYMVRDDHPWVDLLVRGHRLQVADTAKNAEPAHDDPGSSPGRVGVLSQLDEPASSGAVWQRWNFEADLARRRTLGELSLALKVPKAHALHIYVIPTQLLDLADVVTMAEDLESELGVQVLWDVGAAHRERAWSKKAGAASQTPLRLIDATESELQAARDIRRRPFEELMVFASRVDVVPENAVVSHWAARRRRQLMDAECLVQADREALQQAAGHQKAERRAVNLANEVEARRRVENRLSALCAQLGGLIREPELATGISPGPATQRDHRLRALMRAFGPPAGEALSPVEAARSQFPPVLLNHLWELWGAVWLVKAFRSLGFRGKPSMSGADRVRACSWTLRKANLTIQLDFEADPTLVDYSSMPPAHLRGEPALEWAARHQSHDESKPFFGMEDRASPDYLIRVTTPDRLALLVGDACLASPIHHGRGGQANAKPVTVEHYRRSIGWVADRGVVRCHPMGGFVVFPPPASAWAAMESIPGARDCTLLCPSPRANDAAERAEARLFDLLAVVAPEAL